MQKNLYGLKITPYTYKKIRTGIFSFRFDIIFEEQVLATLYSIDEKYMEWLIGMLNGAYKMGYSKRLSEEN